jgi:P27 family predicted phage terminase small subunit
MQGSDRVSRRKDEPVVEVVRPVPPVDLSDAARAVWDRTVDQLYSLGVSAQIDAAALARYCTWTVRFWAAVKVIETEGETYPLLSKEGQVRALCPRPEVAIARSLAEQMLNLEKQFGMTPASRPDVRGVKQPKGDPMGAILGARRNG